MNLNVLSVSQLNRFVKSMLEGDARLSDILIKGEISNLSPARSSGHLYFTLKDDRAAVRAVMFSSYARRLPFLPQNGMAVLARASVSLYERDGAYQLYVTELQPDGLGSLHLAYEQLKARLEAEGLFSDAHKKPLPRYPSRIGVITSEHGAALQDIIQVLSRRYPVAALVLCPVLVQGENAAGELVRAVRRMNLQKACDVMIIGRGGGSLEDLWAFNNEELAREIYRSEIPVVSAVGHETDYTICDFVSDFRAPTPSAAAAAVVPDRQDLQYQLDIWRGSFQDQLLQRLDFYRERLRRCGSMTIINLQNSRMNMNRQRLEHLIKLIEDARAEVVERNRTRLKHCASLVEALGPMQTLRRGYAVVRRDGKALTRAAGVAAGDLLEICLADGTLTVRVEHPAQPREETLHER